MPMSAEAMAGLRAAVRWNPAGARALVDILDTWPAAVRRKPEDRYGPIGFVFAYPHRRAVAPGVSAPIFRPPPFPPASLPACERFNAEWLSGHCTRRDLADALAMLLREDDDQAER